MPYLSVSEASFVSSFALAKVTDVAQLTELSTKTAGVSLTLKTRTASRFATFKGVLEFEPPLDDLELFPLLLKF